MAESNTDIIKILLGFLSGVILSLIGFVFSYRHAWRNRFTGEIKVSLKEIIKLETDDDAKSVVLSCRIDCTNSDEFLIKSIYFKIPNTISGSIPPNPTFNEIMSGKKGRFYVVNTGIEFKNTLVKDFTLKEPQLTEIKKWKSRIRFIVNTSKYGKIKSNYVNL